MFIDFESFKSNLSWFIRTDDHVAVETGTILINSVFAATFPTLNTIIQKARVLDVTINADVYKLFSWTTHDGYSCGWLCKQEPADISAIEILPEHQLLLDTIGGIKESYNQPDSFSNNQYFLFIKSLCAPGIGGWDIYYRMACEEGEFVSFPADNLVSFVQEGNGDLTLYDRESRQVYLFAHDHAFDYVTMVNGQPDYTYYTINGVNSFIDYVESLAEQWRMHIAGM